MSEKKQVEKKNEIGKSGWYLVWEHVAEHPIQYIICILSIAISSTLASTIPRIIAKFTNTISSGKLTLHLAMYFGLLVLAVGIVRVTLGWIGRLISAKHGRMLNYKVRDKLFKKWETLPISYYHEHTTGDLLSHALNDVQVVQQLASMGLNTAISSVFMISGALYVMFIHINWSLALAGFGPMLAIPFIVRYYSPKIKRQSAKVQETLGGMSQSVEEIVSGIRTVKAFGNEEVVINRFGERIDDIVRERMKQVKLSAIFSAIIPFTVSIGFIMVIAYGGYLTIIKTISLGDFVSFLLYLILLRQPLEQLGNTLNTFQRGSASLSRLAILLDAPLAVSDRETASNQAAINGSIEVKNLSFRYPGTNKNVLTDISFKINKGQTLGIIGTIGSGKTSLANLLMRIYDPPLETVFVDGIDVHNYYLKDLRQSIAFVPQSGFLFSTTIDANIAFAEDKLDKDKVEISAKSSVVHDDILKLKDMYKTEIGERGVRLSGGQKQRVAIARAIYKDSPINILDDSLSAVDTNNERLILQNLRQGEKNKTNIIISHRLSAVMHSEEIIILDEGRIIDRGTHQHLLKTSEFYNKLWSIQSGGIEDNAPIVDETVKATLIDTILTEEENEEVEEKKEGGEYGA
jgi:ATP-binding cassette subfamily B protein